MTLELKVFTFIVEEFLNKRFGGLAIKELHVKFHILTQDLYSLFKSVKLVNKTMEFNEFDAKFIDKSKYESDEIFQFIS